jgi:hypothetical protein
MVDSASCGKQAATANRSTRPADEGMLIDAGELGWSMGSEDIAAGELNPALIGVTR